MSKNKFIKKLLIAGLCALTATAMVGATACKDKGGDDEEPAAHVHVWSENYKSDATNHWKECTAAGHEGDKAGEKTAHTDTDKNNKCDVCGYTLSTGDNEGPGDDEEDPNVTYATEKVKIDISKIDSLTANAEIVAGSGIYATSAMAMEAKDRTILYDGETVNTTKWFKTGGGVTKTEKSLKFEIENDNSVIIIYASSATNGTERFVTIKTEGENNSLVDVDGQTEQSIGKGNNLMGTAIFKVNKGTYYVGSSKDGINIAYVAVWEGGKLNETVVESKQEKAATCEEAGNITYTKTNFGRYKNASGAFVTEDTISSPATGHDYKLDETTLHEPTKDGEGSIGYICANDAAHNNTAVLPALTSDKYEVIDDDESLAEGEAYYTYVIPNIKDSANKNISLTFTAEKATQTKYKYETRYSNILDGTVPIGKANATALAEGIKIYGMTNKSTEVSAWDSNYSVTASNDTLTVEDKGYSDSSKKSAFAFIVFDDAITSGVYKVSGKITMSNFGNGTSNNSTTGNWCPLQLIKNDSTAAGDTFATLRTDNDKKLCVLNHTNSKDENNNTYSVPGAVSYTAGTEYYFEFIIDLDSESKSVSLTIKESAESTTALYSDTVSVTTDKWTGLKFQTADGADRTVVLKNLVIAEKVIDTGSEG